MEIKSYPNASDMPEKYLPSLVDAQIECWGAKPFDEYMICSDKKCRALHSIEEIHGSIKNFRENRNKEVDCNCAECGSQLELYYKKDEFLDLVKSYFTGEISAILLIEDNLVEGFGLLAEKTLFELLELELGTRPKSYKNHLLDKKISKKINDIFICINHIYVSEKFRGQGYGKEILSEMIKMSGIQDKSIITETRYDSNFYSMCKSIGLEEVVNDRYGYVLMELNKKGVFTQKNLLKIFNSISENFLNFKKEALKILDLNSIYSYRKNYL